ncbi:MAG TPA: hypothetical protein VHY37_07930 [Tepidisphaeraceae bacterium]|jgi:hypothetical protein|nr:hypothetical protein [Tepidisphaeraceae bacterium]
MIVRPTWRNCLILTGVLFASIVCGLGCNDDHSIRTYQSSKDATPPASAFGPGAQTAGQPAGPSAQQSMDISWDLPPGWKMLPPPTDPQARSMEVARIAVADGVPSAMLTIVPLGGEGGELLPNVARWQRQLKMTAATTPQDVIKVAKLLTTPFGDVPVIDLSSPAGAATPERIVAAAIPFTDFTCFVTLRGPFDTISKQRDHFDAFIRSLKFAPTGLDNTGNTPPAAAAPNPSSPAPAPAAPGAADASAAPTYQAPADWKPAPANNGMRVLGFNAGPALITVDRLPASGMNNPNALVNMWRSQVGLGALGDTQPVKPDAVVTIDGHIGMLFDMASPADKNGKRVIVAMATVGNDDWFFKLIGPADAVAGQKSAFLAFIQSIHFAGGGNGGM